MNDICVGRHVLHEHCTAVLPGVVIAAPTPDGISLHSFATWDLTMPRVMSVSVIEVERFSVVVIEVDCEKTCDAVMCNDNLSECTGQRMLCVL